LGALGAFGTAGYMWLERLSLVDALYLTAVTVSTVGYGDVVPVTPAGRMFTVVLIVVGAGTGLYLLGALAQNVLEGQLRDLLGRKVMLRDLARLQHHVVLCGFGRFGRAVAEELVRGGERLVVIDTDPGTEPALRQLGVPYLIGSALSDEILEQAGIARARALVVATGSDSDNVFITLSARERNPGLHIHARAESEAGLRRLRLAGAQQIVSAYQIGGTRMAASILRPAVVDFVELSTVGSGESEVALEEIRAAPATALVGRTIAELEAEQPRLRIVAVKHPGEAMRIAPDPTTTIRDDDLLVAFGDRASLESLAGLALSSAAGSAARSQ
jgi:voltage-gated potassium channel